MPSRTPTALDPRHYGPTKLIEVELDVLNDEKFLRKFSAFSHGGYWNGWAMPYFERKTADAIIAAFNDRFKKNGNKGKVARYRHEDDKYVFLDDDGEIEEYSGVEFGDGILYPIGFAVWTWFQVDD